MVFKRDIFNNKIIMKNHYFCAELHRYEWTDGVCVTNSDCTVSWIRERTNLDKLIRKAPMPIFANFKEKTSCKSYNVAIM